MEILPIIQASTGPAGAIVVLFCVLVAIYRLSVLHAFPIAKEYVNNQQANMKEILSEHREDRIVFTSSIQILAKRQDKLEDAVEDIKTDVKKIMEKI